MERTKSFSKTKARGGPAVGQLQRSRPNFKVMGEAGSTNEIVIASPPALLRANLSEPLSYLYKLCFSRALEAFPLLQTNRISTHYTLYSRLTVCKSNTLYSFN